MVFEKQIAVLVHEPLNKMGLWQCEWPNVRQYLFTIKHSIGEFDPGSERTLAAGLIHASRMLSLLSMADG